MNFNDRLDLAYRERYIRFNSREEAIEELEKAGYTNVCGTVWRGKAKQIAYLVDTFDTVKKKAIDGTFPRVKVAKGATVTFGEHVSENKNLYLTDNS